MPIRPPIEELARRYSANLEVALLWCRRTGQVWLTIFDVATEEQISLPVPGEHALDAFQHPFAYITT